MAVQQVDLIIKGVWRCAGGPVNWYFLVEDGDAVLVDAGLPAGRRMLEPALAHANRALGDLVAVVLTHGHPDHVGFAEAVRQCTGVPVFVHEEDAELVRTQRMPRSERSRASYCARPRAWRTFADIVRGGRPRPVAEVRTFRDGDELDVPGRPRVIHIPGHTAGSCALSFPSSGALLVGDALCEKNPFLARRGPQLMPAGFSVSSRLALESLNRLSAVDASVIGFGHGEPWTQGVSAALDRAYAAGIS
jgi:glyoxylase-like metal-dependent hydrolase (beta-lactamase superfamily II)